MSISLVLQVAQEGQKTWATLNSKLKQQIQF